jgi:phage tail-like protein
VAASAEARPRNPLRNFQFRIKVQTMGQNSTTAKTEFVAGCRSVSGLQMQVTPFETWEGGNNLHRYVNPNKVTWDPIVLEQGLALDDTLEKWAQAVVDFVRSSKRPAPGAALKREVFIEVWDPHAHGPDLPGAPKPGQGRFRVYQVHNAWISKFHALPKLDSMGNEVALLSVELTHEGWNMTQASPPQ